MILREREITNIDRRKFLTGAALASGAVALAGMTGCAPDAQAVDPDTTSAETTENTKDNAQAPVQKNADIVVVGAGGAGLCAALTAEEGGASVILIEALSQTGGATSFSHVTAIPGSQLQRDRGIEETPEQIEATYNARIDKEDHNLLAVTKTFSENVGQTIDWMAQDMGVDFGNELDPDNLFGYPEPRVMFPIGGGLGVVETLTEKVENSSIELLLETTVTALIKEAGAVIGAIAEAEDGTTYQIDAKAVIFAGGGFTGNNDLIPYTRLYDAIYYGAPSSVGKGLNAALYGGAMLKNLSNIPMQGGGFEVSPGLGIHATFSVMYAFRASGILIGPDGKRVVNEAGPSNEVNEAYRTLPDSTAYLFMDKATFDVFYETGISPSMHCFSPEAMENWLENDGEELPIAIRADTVDEAALKAGIDAENLQATINTFNSGVAEGIDPEFGRAINTPIGEGPYYIFKQNLRYAHSVSGLVTNGDFEVLDWTGTPIPGLYGSGEMVCMVVGGATSTTYAYTSGRYAAQKALTEILREQR